MGVVSCQVHARAPSRRATRQDTTMGHSIKPHGIQIQHTYMIAIYSHVYELGDGNCNNESYS